MLKPPAILRADLKRRFVRSRKCMRIEQFEDIDAWHLARELTRKVYDLTKKTKFTHNFGLKKQIQDAAG